MNAETNHIPGSLEEQRAIVKDILNKTRNVCPSTIPAYFISYTLKTFCFVPFILIGLGALTLFGAVSVSFLLRTIEVVIVVCIFIYSVVLFCTAQMRGRLLVLYEKYPYAIDVIWNWNSQYDINSVPDFFRFQNLDVNECDFRRIMLPTCIKKDDLETLNIHIHSINEQIKAACAKNHEEIVHYLVGAANIRANISKTYTYGHGKRIYLSSIKTILRNSINSIFAWQCIKDIIEGHFDRYPVTKKEYDTALGKGDVFHFIEPSKKYHLTTRISMWIIPVLLITSSSIYCSSRIRTNIVTQMVKQNVESAKIADAIVAKLDILEQFVSDSIAFEKATTVPVKYSVAFSDHVHIGYVGDVYNNGYFSYDGKHYSRSGTFFYTYGTDITLNSFAQEDDDVPAKARKEEVICLNKEDLSRPYITSHHLTIVENRGRFTGYYGTISFDYHFSVNGPEFPTNKRILTAMLSAYDESNEDFNIKDSVKTHFFDKISYISSEELIMRHVDSYQCVDHYHIDINKEIEGMKELLLHR